MAERKMADALDQLYKDGVKMEVQKAKGELWTELDSKLETKAPLNSPALTGTPTAPTPAANDNSAKIATTAYVAQRIQNLINAAPAALDTLGEIATALKNNPNAIQEILTALGKKLDKATADNSYAPKSILDNMVQQGTGTSDYLWMSQKAVTDALANKADWNQTTGAFVFRQSPSTDRRSLGLDNRTLLLNGINLMKIGDYCTVGAVFPDNAPQWTTQFHINAPGGLYVNGTKIG